MSKKVAESREVKNSEEKDLLCFSGCTVLAP